MLLKKLTKRKIDREDLIKFGAISGLLEVVYIVLVAGFFLFAESLFPVDSGSAVIGIVAVLILLVFSAGVSAVLIFGLPFYFMIQSKYEEAGITLISSAATIIAVFILMILGEIFIY
jgi:hypothetical protein